jgi:PPOX class probable F420-dependent enzyme
MELHDALDFARTRDQGVLVTTKRDGRPQLSNITYSLGDDGVVRISVTASRAKTANARRDPRVSLYVTRDDFYAYAVIEGRAEVTPVATDPGDATVEELIEYYRAAAGEHPDWDEYRRVMVADGRLVLRVHPERAYGMLPTPTG